MRINNTIKTLIISDFFILSGIGLIGPIFAVFVTKQINGGDLKVVGFASMIYLFCRAIIQLLVARLVDKQSSEKYDFAFLVAGSFLLGLTPLGFIFSSLPWHIYVLEALNGLGFAMALPCWYAIFTRHIDRGNEGLEWSASDTSIAFGQAIAAAVGGLLAEKYGFPPIFLLISALSLIGAIFLIFIFRDLKSQKIVIPRGSSEDFIRPLRKRLIHKRIY
jgi:MFS family permease